VALFEGKRIRKILSEVQWWFSLIDIVEVLTASNTPKRYWSDLKRKLAKEGYSEWYDKIVPLKFTAAAGKYYATDCAYKGGFDQGDVFPGFMQYPGIKEFQAIEIKLDAAPGVLFQKFVEIIEQLVGAKVVNPAIKIVADMPDCHGVHINSFWL